MKRNCFTIASVCLLTMMLFSACTQKFPGYKKTESGLYYKFYNHNTTAPKPNQTDVMKVAMTCYLHDSVYFDFQKTESEVYAQLKESVFPADLNEAYTMMHLGDSASFYIKADSVALLYYDKDPKSVLGRIWRWHINFCPGFKAYFTHKDEETQAALREKYDFRKYQ